MAANKRTHSRGDPALLAIAVFKLIKAGLILAFAYGAMSFFHKDVASQVQHWLDQLRVDPDNRLVGALLTKLQLVDTKQLKELSAISAGYAALFLTEGSGLLLRKRWAEWLTIIATGSFIPLEVYELIRRFTAVRLVLLLVNAAVVVFLIYRIRKSNRRDPQSFCLPPFGYDFIA